MNEVSLTFEKEINATVEAIWEIVRDIYAYPSYMPSVSYVEKLELNGNPCSKWEISARGHIVNWTSIDNFNDAQMRYGFEQVEGDFSIMNGFFQVSKTAQGASKLSCEFIFDIGIPVMAKTLHPIFRDVLLENLAEIASCVENRVSPVPTSLKA
jgi:ribosome-associated toxin RatA of RatAB toxin-antitoxin module